LNFEAIIALTNLSSFDIELRSAIVKQGGWILGFKCLGESNPEIVAYAV